MVDTSLSSAKDQKALGIQAWRGPKIETRLDLFAFLLAFAMSIHHHPAEFETHFDTPFMPVIAVSSILLLLRPSSTAALLVLVAASVGDGVMLSPLVPNHYTLLVIMFSVVIVGALTLGLSQPSGTDSPRGYRERLSSLVLGVAAVSFSATFIAAAFHKMNEGFFDRAIGCAVTQFSDLVDTIPFAPTIATDGWLSDSLTIGTLIAELAIALLVFVRKTRWIGLGLAGIFGLVMGFNGHPAFSALTMCMYVPFIPSTLPKKMFETSGGWRSMVIPFAAGVGISIFVVGAIAGVFGLEIGSAVLSRIPYLLVAPPFFLLVFVTWRSESFVADREVVGRDFATWASIAAVLVLLCANSVMPYLGIRSTGTFSMFSNLRVESSVGEWNHFWVPESSQVFDHHDEWVEILPPTEVEPEILLGDRGDFYNFFELRRAVSEECDIEDEVPVRYRSVNTDEIYETDNGCSEPVGEPISYWEQRLVSFRPIAEPNVCLL